MHTDAKDAVDGPSGGSPENRHEIGRIPFLELASIPNEPSGSKLENSKVLTKKRRKSLRVSFGAKLTLLSTPCSPMSNRGGQFVGRSSEPGTNLHVSKHNQQV